MPNDVDRAIEAMQEATAAAHERTRVAADEVGNQIRQIAAIMPIVTPDSLAAMIDDTDFETEENNQ